MRILFVGTNPGGGGTESHFITLARALAAHHEVTAAVRPGDFIHRALANDPRVLLCAAAFRSRRDLRAIWKLTRLVRAVQPDWIVGAFKAEYWALAAVAKFTGVPLVLFSHLDQRIRPVMLNRVLGLANGVVVPSQYLRGRKIERGLPASRVAVLGNPIDTGRLRPDPVLRHRIRSSLGVSDDTFLLGYVGRFEPAKGVETLARALNAAAADQRKLHALWVGHGASKDALRDLVDRAGARERHHWLPWLDDVAPAYAAMDALALPSEGSETFGRVLVEAQSCEVPVLGARNGGIPEALADGVSGRLLTPGDVGSWTSAIRELASDQAMCRQLGRAGRDFASRFDSGRIAADFVEILEQFRASPAPRGVAVRGVVPVTLAAEPAVD